MFYRDDQAFTLDRVRLIEPEDRSDELARLYCDAYQDVSDVIRARREIAAVLRKHDSLFRPFVNGGTSYPMSAIVLEALDEFLWDDLRQAAVSNTDCEADESEVLQMLWEACK